MWLDGEPICVRTLSSHWSGPSRWISIQHGVEVTSWRWYSAPHPLTKDILNKKRWSFTFLKVYCIFVTAIVLQNTIRHLAILISLPYSTHFCQFKNCFISMLNRLAKQWSKLLIVEYSERTRWGNFTYSCGMKSMMMVTISWLDKDCTIGKAFSKYLAIHIC